MKFYTKYYRKKDIARQLDKHDNVDRLSFIDNKTVINNLMSNGENLQRFRALSQIRSMYSDVEALSDDTTKIPALPVYGADLVVLGDYYQELKRLKNSLTSVKESKSKGAQADGQVVGPVQPASQSEAEKVVN